jgi:citrate lyase subunit beta / citryl-CoA lyase
MEVRILPSQPGSGAVRRLARRLGFDGKIAIHLRSVPVIHEVFSVSAQEIARAHRMLEAFREAEARGPGRRAGSTELWWITPM